ncbi:MAG: hypothetical protein IKZ54_03005 [Bacteroidales bacterium]|nr:hypothetical protein [Bacteroidales bacterium]
MKTTRKMALVEKIILGLLVMAAFCFARQCKWTDVDIHPAWSGSNQTSDEYFIASYECDDGFKNSTPTISNRFVRFAENNTILYYIRFSGTPLCEFLYFNGNAVSSNSATSSKCGL